MKKTEKSRLGNGAIVAICCSFVIGMVGAAYAAVPLYEMFCKVTGYGGTTQRVEQASDVILDKKIKVRFDANVGPGLPWTFEPVQREVEIRIGETVQVLYKTRNHSSKATTGQATFNVTPEATGAYFNKVQCFCFTETTLKPGEELECPSSSSSIPRSSIRSRRRASTRSRCPIPSIRERRRSRWFRLWT